MLIRHHQAKIQIKKEKKKPGYEVLAVARVRSGTFFLKSDGQKLTIVNALSILCSMHTIRDLNKP
jgi:hypothetical protein